jgi:hypothetical protein
LSNRSPILARPVRHLLLRHAKFASQPLIGPRLFDRIQVCPLQVFDDGDFHRLLVGNLAQDRWNRRLPGLLRGQPATLAGNQLVAPIRLRTYHDRLHHSVRLDRLRQFREQRFIELRSCLKWIAVNLRQRNLQRFARLRFGLLSRRRR